MKYLWSFQEHPLGTHHFPLSRWPEVSVWELTVLVLISSVPAFPFQYRPLPTSLLFVSVIFSHPSYLSISQVSDPGLDIEIGEPKERWAGSGKTVDHLS